MSYATKYALKDAEERIVRLEGQMDRLMERVADLEKFKADKNTWLRTEPGRVPC